MACKQRRIIKNYALYSSFIKHLNISLFSVIHNVYMCSLLSDFTFRCCSGTYWRNFSFSLKSHECMLYLVPFIYSPWLSDFLSDARHHQCPLCSPDVHRQHSVCLLSDSKAKQTYHMPRKQCKTTIRITHYCQSRIAHMARVSTHTHQLLPDSQHITKWNMTTVNWG